MDLKLMPTLQKATTKSKKSDKSDAGRLIHELRVKPHDQFKVFLGRFELSEKIKGFVIEVRPSTVPAQAVIAKITRSDFDSNTKFFLSISNKGQRAISARIRLI